MAGSSVGPHGPYHIILRDKPSPTTSVGLVLDMDENGAPSYREGRAKAIPPKQSEGAYDWSHQDPEVDFTYAVDDFSGGGLWSVWDDAHRNFYGQANGLDARWRNVLTLGMKLNGPGDFLLRNGGAEYNAITGWTKSGTGALSAISTDSPRTGTYQFKFTTTTANDKFTQTLMNPEVFRSTEITVYAFLKRGGTGTATARLNIVDTGTTNGTTQVLSTSFQQITATRTISATAVSITIEVEFTAAASTPNVFIDDIFIVPTGGVISAGMCSAPWNPLHNGSAEVNFTTETFTTPAGAEAYWALADDGGTTALTNTTSNVRDGLRKYHLANDTNGKVSKVFQTIDEAVEGLADLQNRTAVLEAYLDSNSAGNQRTRTYITDASGSTYSGWDDDATYALSRVERPLDAGSSMVFGIEADGGSGSVVNLDFDQFRLRVYDSDGLLVNKVYATFGRVVCMWDEVSDVWNAVYVHAGASATSIVEFNGLVHVAFGGDNAYIVGTGANFYVRSQDVGGAEAATNDNNAHFFTVSRNALWKSRSDGESHHHSYLNDATDSEDASQNWGTEQIVGELGRVMTGLYSVSGEPVIGREDGLHHLRRNDTNFAGTSFWENITQQFVNDPSMENFRRSTEYKGWTYFTTKNQGLYRYNGSQIEDLTSSLFDPGQSDFGGGVRALTSGSAQVFLLMDTPTTDADSTKETWLLSLREEGGKLLIHPLEKVTIGNINELMVAGDFLWAIGRIYDDDLGVYRAVSYRWDMPKKVVAPAYDAAPLINTTGTITLSKWHGGAPNLQKALISCILLGDDLDAQHKITVKVGIDGVVPTDAVGTTWGSITANKGTLGTSNFTTPTTEAVGYDFTFRLALETDDTVSPKVRAIAFKFVLVPEKKRLWEMSVWIGAPYRNDQMIDGVARSKTTLLSSLNTLEDQVYPIQLVHDFDQNDDETDNGSGAYVKIRAWERQLPEIEEERRGARPSSAELYRLVLQEV